MNNDELRILAHTFLTAKAGEAETAVLRSELENNPASALELLAQMQEALGAPVPGVPIPGQDEAIEKRVEALIASHRRKGLLGLFKGRLSRSKPVAVAPAPVAAPLAGSGMRPPLAPPPASASSAPESDLEDMAPIAQVPEPAVAPLPPPVAPLPAGAPEAIPVRVRPARGRPMKVAGFTLLVALLALGLYYGFFARAAVWMPRARPAAALPTARRRPLPRPIIQGPPVRADAAAPALDAPLPAELPRSTPRASSTWN